MGYLAEQNLIGALLMDKDCMEHIHNTLKADMFTSEFLGKAYLEFQRGYDNRYNVDLVIITQKMAGENVPEDIVLEEMKKCLASVPCSVYVKDYAEAIVSEYKARKLKDVLNQTSPSPNRIELQIGELINKLEALQESKSAHAMTLPEIVRGCKNRYFIDNEEEKLYIGFPKLDDLLGGLEGGDMIVIGARPAVGKSALVTQITSNLAKQGKRVGFYNLEMKEKQVYERFVVSESGIGLTRLRRAKRFLGDEKERFDRANEVLGRQENIIITTGSKSISEIRAEVRHMRYDIIIIDYLQLLKADTTYRGNRTAEVGAISKAIKALAMELNIPIIALSQLNRVSEMKETKEPTMAELREAGDIEQDASVIILMWNLSQEDRSKKGCKVEKQRQGQTGQVVMRFNGDMMQFEETDETVKEAKEWARVADDDCPF